jgi:hypothetical protein
MGGSLGFAVGEATGMDVTFFQCRMGWKIFTDETQQDNLI